jgi:hypothetical protein
VTDFRVEHEGEQVPVLNAPHEARRMDKNKDDSEMCEYLVEVDWTDTRKIEDAVYETRMSSNQNIVCKLRNQFTVERLLSSLDVEE